MVHQLARHDLVSRCHPCAPMYLPPPPPLCPSGPAGDKKAMSEFRRKQQEERKRLDKAKTKWHSEQVGLHAEQWGCS